MMMMMMMMKFIRPVLNLKGPSLYYIIHFLRSFHCSLSPYRNASSSISTFSNCLNRTMSRVWLVASELEDHSSKCSMSYSRRLKRDLLGHEGAGVSRDKGEGMIFTIVGC